MCVCVYTHVCSWVHMNVGASVCVCDVCAHMCMHTGMCTHVYVQRLEVGVQYLVLTYLDQVFHLYIELTIWLVQLASLL